MCRSKGSLVCDATGEKKTYCLFTQRSPRTFGENYVSFLFCHYAFNVDGNLLSLDGLQPGNIRRGCSRCIRRRLDVLACFFRRPCISSGRLPRPLDNTLSAKWQWDFLTDTSKTSRCLRRFWVGTEMSQGISMARRPLLPTGKSSHWATRSTDFHLSAK